MAEHEHERREATCEAGVLEHTPNDRRHLLCGEARVAPGRRLTMGGFLTTPQLASLLSVPSLCFVLVWLIGRL